MQPVGSADLRILESKRAAFIFANLILLCAFRPATSSRQWEEGLPMNAGETVLALMLGHLPR